MSRSVTLTYWLGCGFTDVHPHATPTKDNIPSSVAALLAAEEKVAEEMANTRNQLAEIMKRQLSVSERLLSNFTNTTDSHGVVDDNTTPIYVIFKNVQ